MLKLVQKIAPHITNHYIKDGKKINLHAYLKLGYNNNHEQRHPILPNRSTK